MLLSVVTGPGNSEKAHSGARGEDRRKAAACLAGARTCDWLKLLGVLWSDVVCSGLCSDSGTCRCN